MADDGWLLPRQSVGKKIGAGASRPLWAAPRIVEAGRHRDTGASVARILKLVLAAHAPGLPSRAHEDYGHQVLVRMDKESFRLKRINIGVCSAKAPERLQPKADDVPPPWIVTVSPKSSLGRQHRYALDGHRPMLSSIEVPSCVTETGDARTAGRANWNRFRSIRRSAQTPAKSA